MIDEKKIKTRILEVEKDLNNHIQRRGQVERVLSNETLQIAASEGAIKELKDLININKKEVKK